MHPPISRMPDGTIKQVSPFTGTEVWTVPGRGNRPLTPVDPAPALEPECFAGSDGVVENNKREYTTTANTAHCAFCPANYLQTPPEKARLWRDEQGRWQSRERGQARQLHGEVADFRRVPNLFEIVSYRYWQTNYQYAPPTDALENYTSDPAGLEHTLAVARTKFTAAGGTPQEWENLGQQEQLESAAGFFAGGHDLIIGKRHYSDGATTRAHLASSGTLTPEEHRHYIEFTIRALEDLYETNRYARYVAVFQNWLKPAGASFDHLHKQLVAIDSWGVGAQTEIRKLRTNPNLYNEWAVNYARQHNLLIAQNEHAVMLAGFGHRYPTLEVYSLASECYPWRQSPGEVAAMANMLHAAHAATGPQVPCNEEWHHRPPDLDLPMPWRIMLKWRVSTLAGFEGGTKIYLNTIDPWALRDRVTQSLRELRGRGALAPGLLIGTECDLGVNALAYNQR